MNCMKYYKITQYVWLKMRDFEVKNAKIFWGGLSPPQTPPNNEEGDTPSSNSSPQCWEGSNFLSFIPPPTRESWIRRCIHLGSVRVISKKYSLKYHLYADDTQLYISFTPTNSALSLEKLTTIFNDILSWMNLNKLLLNHLKLNLFSLAQNNNVSNFLILQTYKYLSAMISSQSAVR